MGWSLEAQHSMEGNSETIMTHTQTTEGRCGVERRSVAASQPHKADGSGYGIKERPCMASRSVSGNTMAMVGKKEGAGSCTKDHGGRKEWVGAGHRQEKAEEGASQQFTRARQEERLQHNRAWRAEGSGSKRNTLRSDYF